MSETNNTDTSNENNANTIMNTIGMVLLKNGQLKFVRFGAAIKRKIKLGTAAFANLVNNLATTEEGFAMDARVGPVIDQRFSDLEEDVESLNSASKLVAVNAYLSAAGWYKVAKRIASSASYANHSSGMSRLIYITRSYSNGNNEAYSISHVGAFDKSQYVVLNKAVNTQLITNIREAYYPAENAVYYEIYYKTPVANTVDVILENNSRSEYLQPVNFELDTGDPTVISNFVLPAS